MRSTRALVGVLVALLLGLVPVAAATGSASGATSGTPSGVETHAAATTKAAADRVTAYWTAKRMREAVPAKAPSTSKASSTPVAKGQPVVVPRAKPGGTTTYPANVVATTGKVFFTMGGSNYVCSGTATASGNQSVVTTAGHCVNEGPGAYVTNFAFVPAYNNNVRPYGTWTARTLVTTTQWAQQGDINYDGGFAVMNTVNGSTLTGTVGGQGIAFSQPRGLFYNAYGYPAAGKFNGQTLKSCSGTATNDPYGTQSQGIPCDMTGGSSGGPWLINSNTVINSLNSFGYQGVRNTMFGPYFGSQIQAAYDTAAGL
jgi:V8-like Glu-specific endopeptidase